VTLEKIAEFAPPVSSWNAPELHFLICLYPHRKGMHSLPITDEGCDLRVLNNMTLADQIEQMKTALTVDEFAGMMNVSKKFVYKMLKRKNGLESYQLFGIIRLDPVATAQWLRSRTLSKRG
jgi:hypothetical protein